MDSQLKDKVLRALNLADDVMSYCQGDAWERECTEESREEFNTLALEIIEELEGFKS